MAIHGRGVGSICHAIEGGVPAARADLTVVGDTCSRCRETVVAKGQARVILWDQWWGEAAPCTGSARGDFVWCRGLPAVSNSVLKCPQCGGSLTPSRFAKTVSCPYCGSTVRLGEQVVSAQRFHQAFHTWDSPETYGLTSWITIGNSHWSVDGFLAKGEIADVYRARRARWPTELVLLKILRSENDLDRFRNEWSVLQELQRSQVPAAPEMTLRVPVPVLLGRVKAGIGAGSWAMALQWAPGFVHTVEEARRVWPQGIDPRISIWIWRRILEVLSFVHATGFVHGAVAPFHLLTEDREHGVRLVGFGVAGRAGEKVGTGRPVAEFSPEWARTYSEMTPALDLALSARVVASLLGGDVGACSVPETVPRELAALIREIGVGSRKTLQSRSAWGVRQELGTIAKAAYGVPKYCPLVFEKGSRER